VLLQEIKEIKQTITQNTANELEGGEKEEWAKKEQE
jgi:hypothetical protein